MKKQLFSVMLCLGAMGGLSTFPMPLQAAVSQSQTIKVKGQIVDDQGEPLTGATIKIKGGQGGTVTDLDGNFNLDAPANATLIVSYVGYKDREIAVRGRAIIDKIQMTTDDRVLDQVVVVGYGTQKKADLTGSVAVVNADQLKKVSNSNISTMLEGKVPGVQITTDGQPGADPSVRIRGISTFGSSAPLYVVDGVPMGTTIRDFSANDIESIQILKDAAAGAIYGSRAGNGVVIITTKHGRKDQPLKVDYSGYFGVDKISKGVYDLMDADQYSNYIGQACANSGTTLPSGYKLGEDGKYHFQDATNTDWFDEVFKTGIRQNHNVNLSGGGANNTYNIALDYFNQKGTIEGAGPDYQRYTARVNNSMDTKFIKFQTSVVYSHSKQNNMALSNASEYVQGLYGDVTNVLRGTLLMQPTIKAYDPSTWVLDDKVGSASGYNYDAYGYGVYYDLVHGDISASNPLLVNNLLKRNTLVDRFVGTGSADVDLLKMIGLDTKTQHLNYKINLSYSKTHAQDFTWIPSWIQSNRVYLAKSNEKLTKGTRTYADALMENTLTYDGQIGKHNINFVAGTAYQEENTNTLTAWGNEFSEPYFLQIQNAKTRDASSFEYKHAIMSYFGRLNYNYDEKYLLSAIVRRDGSSRLSKDKRWSTFPSVSLGWRIDKEKFFPVSKDIINLLKLRASYGEIGIDNVGDYAIQTTMDRNNMSYSFGNNIVYGSAISTFVNQNLEWERRITKNIGLDLAMFGNRLEFTAEWYKNRSKKLLYGVPVPENAGVSNTSVTMNAATLDNSGWEFSGTYRNNDHPLKYQISANLSTLKNKVVQLGFSKDAYITGNYITELGKEIGKFYGYVYEGIARIQADLDNHATQQGANVGDCLYKDISGPDGKPDGKIDENDRVVLGSGMPKVNFGISAHLEYKGFDLSISTFGALGYHVTDDIYNSLNSCYGWANKDVAMADANRWSEDGKTYLSNVPRTYATNNAQQAWNGLFSSRQIQNAAYWKIANVELGYNMPDKWFGGYVNSVRVYVSAQNLYTFTGYHGYNVDYAGGVWTPGYNFCSFPTPRTFMCGLHFSHN